MTVEVFYDGKQQKAVEITPQTLFPFDNKFVLEGDAVTAGKHEVDAQETGRRAALLQRLPDQLHPGGLHHQGRPGDQGPAQVLQARQGRQVDRGRRLARAGRRPEGREVRAPGVGEPGHAQERRPGGDRAGDRQQERLRVPGLRGHEARRLRAGRPAERLHGQRPGGLRRVSATTAWSSSPAPWPAASTAWPTACGPRFPAGSAPCPPGPGPCTPRS